MTPTLTLVFLEDDLDKLFFGFLDKKELAVVHVLLNGQDGISLRGLLQRAKETRDASLSLGKATYPFFV